MLVSFSVRNFRSFADETTLDLRTPRGVGAGARPWDGNVQTVAAVYGANASGKTTLVEAVAAMATQVRDSYRLSTVTAEPFAFGGVGDPTVFAATFVAADGVCYTYGFAVADGAVTEEWAQRFTTVRPTLLFERHGAELRFGAALKGPNRAVEQTVRPSNLYLSAAAAAGHEGLAPVSAWFTSHLRTYSARGHESFLGHVVAALVDDAARCERVGQVLRTADLGLTGIAVDRYHLSDAERADMTRAADALRAVTGQDTPVPDNVYRVFGVHHANGHDHQLPWEAESDGTNAMLCHAFVVDEALRTGATVLFDEIDASVHPLLVRELVATFQDPQRNPAQAQLVFTSHDVSLMDAGYGNGAQLG
ncbi:MAG: AAA family ATPase, partial [Micrococcales bacterium]|nr:AAA family ATPase [Micrococcales bacterium]